MSNNNRDSRYRRNLLALSATNHMLVMAIPLSCLPVLFKEIADDLGLNLVQIGTVWGMAGLAGVFTHLLGGWLGDRFGVKLILTFACVLAGVTGALRGLADGFASLAAVVFLFGLVRSLIAVNVHKTVSIWFLGRNLSMANGIVSMGMGVGLMLGPLISATLLSPLLGGWRNVLFLYGAVTTMIGILWFIFLREPRADPVDDSNRGAAVSEALSKLIRGKDIWLLALGLTFRTASIAGMMGYLPLYLRGRGWAASSADGALAAFFAASALTVIPLSMLSDRLGLRKPVIFWSLLTGVVGIGVLSIADGVMAWLAIIIVGMFMDGFMAVIITMVQETPGVGSRYSGIALGLVLTISGLGSFISPPLGNSLASINPGLPFVFWASLSIVSLVSLAFTKETGRRKVRAAA